MYFMFIYDRVKEKVSISIIHQIGGQRWAPSTNTMALMHYGKELINSTLVFSLLDLRCHTTFGVMVVKIILEWV